MNIIEDRNTVPEDESELWEHPYKISNLIFTIDSLWPGYVTAGLLFLKIQKKRVERNGLDISNTHVSWMEGSGSEVYGCYDDSELDEILAGWRIERLRKGGIVYTKGYYQFYAPSEEHACLKILLDSDIITFPDNIRFDKFDFLYPLYIKSDLWRARSTKIKELAGRKCSDCGKTGILHSHHLTYERLGNELPADLLCVCKSCHFKLHNKKSLYDIPDLDESRNL